MATKTTRFLSNSLKQDCLYLDVTPSTYEDKWGVIKINIASISWTDGEALSSVGDGGIVNIKVPNFYKDSDDIILDNYAIVNSQGSHVINRDYYFAVNNGYPPPSAYINKITEGWDLIKIDYKLASGNSFNNMRVTVTYTVTFTDLTPVSTSTSGTTIVDLVIAEDKSFDQVDIALNPISSEYALGESGYSSLEICSLAFNYTTAFVDQSQIGSTFALSSPTKLYDYSQNFNIQNQKHTFNKFFFVVAFNKQKPDLNAQLMRIGSANITRFLTATLVGNHLVADLTATLEYKFTHNNF